MCCNKVMCLLLVVVSLLSMCRFNGIFVNIRDSLCIVDRLFEGDFSD